jgi:hypothetical protein
MALVYRVTTLIYKQIHSRTMSRTRVLVFNVYCQVLLIAIMKELNTVKQNLCVARCLIPSLGLLF